MIQEWDIKSRSTVCTKCQAAFQDKQPYFSFLKYTDEGYQRGDYCEACWPDVKREGSPYSMWRGVYQVPPAKPEDALKKETAESLLRKLLETEDPSRRNVVFILAVMLERNKLLAERDVQKKDDGTWLRVYEHRKTGETFLIPDPRLRLEELEKVQIEVITLLGGKPPASAGQGTGGVGEESGGDVPADTEVDEDVGEEEEDEVKDADIEEDDVEKDDEDDEGDKDDEEGEFDEDEDEDDEELDEDEDEDDDEDDEE